ncbi:NAD(P)-binding protein [Saccharata proteae CBS 121410]|uniref:NAD(P)-binding protein n=1 Tax=Saccharata proteae CBS 121410 TaxID=1314787 RepID=A0A9P4HTD3_9PEZI|nr:NAD(P)-binding protein [Saccharata proteae CBS 121410]
MATSRALALEDIVLRELRNDELLIEISVSSICHTDLHCGCGCVRKIGSAVTIARPVDPVLLSSSYCGTYVVCRTRPPSHCHDRFSINFLGERATFANHTIVNEKSFVNVAGLGLSNYVLKILAPFGCGLRTGSGTVINVAKATEYDTIAIVGMGGVGLAAVMAVKTCKCKIIIGVDIVQSRLDFAKSLGATHTINFSDLSLKSLISAVRKPVAVEIESTRTLGKIIQVGTDFMVSGKQDVGAIQGHSRPRQYLPRLVEWYKQGIFQVEKIVKSYAVEDWECVVKATKDGTVVKPILVNPFPE